MKTSHINQKSNLRNLINTALALMMTVALGFGLVLPAYALPTDEAPAGSQAAITKILETPIGTILPSDLVYSFFVEKIAEDGQTPSSLMPTIGTGGIVEIPFLANTPVYNTDGDTDIRFLESYDIFLGKTWPHGGIYEYKVTEVDSMPNHPIGTDPKEEMYFSKAEYTLKVYVNDQLQITHIGALRTVDDAGQTIDPEDQKKLIVTPGGGTEDDLDYSEMTFTNTYAKTNDTTEITDPDEWTLAISKEVAGDYANKSFYFDFDLTVNAPSLITTAPTYKAYIVEPDTANPGKYKVVTNPAEFNGITGGAGGLIEVKSGQPISFKLKHGQKLAFINTHVGANYLVTETGSADYTPKASVYVASQTKGVETVASLGDGLTLHHIDNDVYKTTLYVGDGGKNSADFTNTHFADVPTGISVDDLPFVILIGLTVAALAGYITIKARRRRYVA